MADMGRFIDGPTYDEDGVPRQDPPPDFDSFGDGDQPPFDGEPKKVDIPNCAEEFFDILWNNLNDGFKVSLFVSYINIKSGEAQEKIINKNI
jgi:hypothetical protein